MNQQQHQRGNCVCGIGCGCGGLAIVIAGILMWKICEDAGKVTIYEDGYHMIDDSCWGNHKISEAGWILMWIGFGSWIVVASTLFCMVFVSWVAYRCDR